MELEIKSLYHWVWNSPIGPIELVASNNALEMLLFKDDRQKKIEKLALIPTVEIQQQANGIIETAIQQLEGYFSGKRKDFDLPFNFSGTLFQQQIWGNLRKIPYGETASYSQLATIVGDRNKIRAVAAANSKNDLLIVVPCHRIVGEKLKLVGYRGGLERKRWLINFEKEHSPGLKRTTLF